MARIRTIKPEFWQDEKLAPMEPIDRLVFLGLISQADDAGRLVNSVRMLDGLLFPYTEDTCEGSLQRLAELGRIRCYESVSGQQLLQISNWDDHQRVDHPSGHTLPAPPAEVVSQQPDSDPVTNPREVLARASRESRAPTMVVGRSSKVQDPRSQSPARTCEEGFEVLWSVRPGRPGDSRKRAFKAWKARLREGHQPDVMVEGMKRYARYIAATDSAGTKYVKMTATFLGPDLHFIEDWEIPRERDQHSGGSGKGGGQEGGVPGHETTYASAAIDSESGSVPDPVGETPADVPLSALRSA